MLVSPFPVFAMSIIKETNEKEGGKEEKERGGVAAEAAWAAQIVALNLAEVHQVVDTALPPSTTSRGNGHRAVSNPNECLIFSYDLGCGLPVNFEFPPLPG